MSSKKEEAKAYEKLKKAFPEADISLTCRYASYCDSIIYETYNSKTKFFEAGIDKGQTADEAVNNLIRRKEELKQKMIDEKENAK